MSDRHQNLIGSELHKGATEYSFINFHPLVLEIQCPQFWRHTDRQTFSKKDQFVFGTSQNMSIRRKPDVENFRKSNTFFLCIYKKVKKVLIENNALQLRCTIKCKRCF